MDKSDDARYEPTKELHIMDFNGYSWLTCSCGWQKLISSFDKSIKEYASAHRNDVINEKLGLEFRLL